MKNFCFPFLLWLTSLTGFAQITLVKQFNVNGGPGQFESLDNILVFNANGQLWRSDGTSAGTTLLKSDVVFSNASYNRCRVGNTIYFYRETGNELWKTDGTVVGTVLVKALGDGGIRGPLFNVNGLLLFGYNTPTTGTEIWRSDGTDSGTYMVDDLLPGMGDGYAYSSPQAAVLDGFLYFQGLPAPTEITSIGSRPTLYRTDGTAAGTTQVSNSGFQPIAMNVINGRLIYVAYYAFDFVCQEPGDRAYPRVLMKVENGVASVLKYPVDEYPYGNTSCPPIPVGYTFNSSVNFINSNEFLYFKAEAKADPGVTPAYNVWRTDGTTEGTIQLTDFVNTEGPIGDARYNWDFFASTNFNFSNRAYFPIKTDATGIELWRSDGSSAGTYLLKDINPTTNTNPQLVKSVAGTTYFFANDGTHGSELWKTSDSKGTQMVQDLNPGSGGQPGFEGIGLGQSFYFYGDNGVVSGLYSTTELIYSLKSGQWNDPTVWSSNQVPSASDSVQLNHSVTITANYLANALNLSFGVLGQLIYQTGGTLRIGP